MSFVQRSCERQGLDSVSGERRGCTRRSVMFRIHSFQFDIGDFYRRMKMFIHETDAVNIVREYREMKSKRVDRKGEGGVVFVRAKEDQIAFFFFNPVFSAVEKLILRGNSLCMNVRA